MGGRHKGRKKEEREKEDRDKKSCWEKKKWQEERQKSKEKGSIGRAGQQQGMAPMPWPRPGTVVGSSAVMAWEPFLAYRGCFVAARGARTAPAILPPGHGALCPALLPHTSWIWGRPVFGEGKERRVPCPTKGQAQRPSHGEGRQPSCQRRGSRARAPPAAVRSRRLPCCQKCCSGPQKSQ